MKTLLLTTTAAALAIMGCDTVAPERIDTSRSYPDLHTGEAVSTGSLYVEGIGSALPHEQNDVRKLPAPTLYSVYDVNGNLVTAPRTNDVELPAGRYLVRPEYVDSDERNPFWVTIEPGKRTVVNTDQIPSDHSRTNVR
jgi:hypothetical protein